MCFAPFTLEDAKAIYNGAKTLMPRAIVDVTISVRGCVHVQVDRIRRTLAIA